MTLSTELSRFESLLADRFPEALASLQPGLGDAGIDRLRSAVAPLVLPEQVETLYRWRDGGALGVFGGWRLRPLDELLTWRDFCLNTLGEPPAWLQLFGDQRLGFVTLDFPAAPSDPSLWYGHTHDATLNRLFDSLAAMVAACADVSEAGLLLADPRGLHLDGVESLEDRGFARHRLARSADAYRYPEPPAGTEIYRFPEPDWPAPWLRSLGSSAEDAELGGATHSIAQLVESSRRSRTAGTVFGRIRALVSVGPVITFTLDDGTDQLAVSCETATTVFGPVIGTDIEADVLLEHGAADRAPSEAERGGDESDPNLAAMMRRLRPAGVPAIATALRPVRD